MHHLEETLREAIRKDILSKKGGWISIKIRGGRRHDCLVAVGRSMDIRGPDSMRKGGDKHPRL